MTSEGAEPRGGIPWGWNGGLASPSMEEHFYPFLLERRPSYRGEEDEEGGEEDLALALERKNKDLLLAAELGKALLERNEELERRREAVREELRETQERLEQEKHALRLKMEVREREWRAQVTDLESELTELRLQMRQQMSEQRECGRGTASAVQELSEQNQRLLEQVAQASLLEQSLTAELQSLREDSRELSLSRGHFTSCLQSENALLLERKRDLEFQVRQLREESETAQNIVYTLKESVLQLERHNSEIDTKLQQVESEAQELRDSQRRLHSQVRELQEELHMRDSRYSMRDGRESLLSEIQQSACCQEQEAESAALGETAHTETYLSQRERELLRDTQEETVRLQDQVTAVTQSHTATQSHSYTTTQSYTATHSYTIT
ncbi:BICD family-like cargo adapter 2 isoform X1 [Ascaphus truei]|uniref:BICD family-like cargo adapter 2 isoform X1 n=2 Tax=Ascaphus truei TaxID=8439 RepID=UPI003F593B5B